MATSNVVSFACPPGREDENGPQLRGGIRTAGRLLGSVLTGSGIAFAAAATAVLVAMMVYPGNGLQIGATGMWIGFGEGPVDYVPFGTLPLHHRVIYVIVGIIRTTPGVLILLNLGALFRLYGRGQVFGRANALYLRAVGLWLIVDAVLPFAMHVILSTTGYEIDRNWMHLTSLQELFAGAIMSVMAEVMKVGSEIENERSQFV